MPLLQPSFRGRLRLFFAVIVIIPMIAVGVVLFQLLDASDNFKLDSRLAEAQTGAQNVYKDKRREAVAALGPIEKDVQLATAVKEQRPAVVRERLEQLSATIGAQQIVLVVDGFGTFETGSDSAIAAARRTLMDSAGRPIGTITVSV